MIKSPNLIKNSTAAGRSVSLLAVALLMFSHPAQAMNGGSFHPWEIDPNCVLVDYPKPIAAVAEEEPTLLEKIFPEAQALCKDSDGESVDAKIRELKVKDARLRSRADHSVLYPTIDTEADYTNDLEDRPDFSYLLYHNYYSATATVTYPLYHWGGPSATAHRGKENLKQSHLQNTVDRRAQQDQILELYFSLMIKTRRLSVQKQELESLIRNLEASSNSGPLSSSQQEENRLQQADKQLDVQQLQDDVDSITKKLKLLTGAESDLSFIFTGFPTKLEIPDSWKPENAVKSLTVQDYESKARVQKDEEAIARAEVRPQVDLLGGFYQDQVDGVNVSHPINSDNYYAALRIRWQLFNGMRSSSNIAAARIRERMNRELARQTQMRDRNDLEDSLRSLKIMAQQYEIALARRKLALQQYDMQDQLTRDGQNSKEGLETARRARDTAEATALEVLSNFLKLYEKTQRSFEVAENA